MLAILISWCYIFFTLLNFGYLTISLLKIPKLNKLTHLGLGLATVLILSHIWAFTDGFGLGFHAFLLVLNIILGLAYRKRIGNYYKEIYKVISQLSLSYKVLIVLVFLLILAKSASLGTVLDNENYYVQTIKWLNEYGFVKGLANLHLFFGQTSGWHVIQSAFSFHFLDTDFNDLGGLLLLMLNLYAIKALKSEHFSFLAGLPLLNWLLLEFTVVPSPDFGIIVFSILIVSCFLRSYPNPKGSDVIVLLFFFISAILIKITALGLIVFPIALLFKLKNKSFKVWIGLFAISFLFFTLWLGKNLIITGYPFFPSEAFSSLISLEHQIPENLYNYSLRKEKLVEFFASTQEVHSLSALELFWQWLTHSKLGLIFNLIILSLLFISPILISRIKSNSRYWWIYASFVFQFVFLAFTSPQYRFMLHYIVIFILLAFGFMLKSPSFKLPILILSQGIAIWFLIFPIRYHAMTSKSYLLESQGFQLSYILTPAPNSSIVTEYKTLQLGNLKYNSPEEEVYFWSNGDGGLPCVNDTQLKYLIKQTGYRPQLIDTTDLSKGFYAERLYQAPLESKHVRP